MKRISATTKARYIGVDLIHEPEFSQHICKFLDLAAHDLPSDIVEKIKNNRENALQLTATKNSNKSDKYK